MNMKKYLSLSIIRKLPLFIIMSITLIAVALISASNVNFVKTLYEGRYFYYSVYDTGVATLIFFFFVFMTILPFFSMNYRYSLARSDALRQAPFGEKYIRYVDHLSSLIIILIAFAFAYVSFVGVLAIENFTTVVPPSTGDMVYLLVVFDYIWFIPLFFGAILGGVLEYFISYLFISRSNNFLNSLLTLLFGQTFLACFLYIPLVYIYGQFYGNFLDAGASFLFAPTYLVNQFDDLIIDGTNYYEAYFIGDLGYNHNYVEAVGLILSMITYVAVGALSIMAFILEKDPSAEWAGKAETEKPYQEIIFHLGFFSLISVISMASFQSFNIAVMFVILFSAVSYVTLYGLLHRSFKFKPYQIGIMVASIVSAFFIGVGFRFRYLYEWQYGL